MARVKRMISLDPDELPTPKKAKVAPVVITAIQISNIQTFRYQIKVHKEKMENLTRELKEREELVISLLQAGGQVESGAPTCVLKKFSRTVISWKDEFIKKVGKAAAELLAKDPKRKKDYTELVIEEKANG